MQLSERIKSLQPSATLLMAQKSAELKAKGIDVINLSLGEPDFPTPQHIKNAAKQAIDNNITTYSPVAGYASLKQAIVSKLQSENGLTYAAEQISVSNGAKQAICNAILSVVNPGDEVIIPAPYWVSYPQMVLLAGGVPVSVKTTIQQDFKLTPSQLADAINSRTKAIILCSPSNPAGAVYSREELGALAEVLKKHPDVFVISDEIYEHINYTGSHASIAIFDGMKERTAVVNGVSKAYAMTGWRIGFLAGPTWLVAGCNKLQGQYTSGASSISQMAALEAFSASQDCVEEMRKHFERRRDLIVSLASKIEGLQVNIPQGAFYLFPQCSSFFGTRYGDKVIASSSDLALYLLEEAHVATVGGDAFGSPECLRLSYATSDENIVEAMARIEKALKKLSK